MIPLEEARRLAASIEPITAQQVPLRDACGCLLAEPVRARQSIPHADTSAMDGWAVAAPLDGSGQVGAGVSWPRWRLRSDGARGPGDLLAPLGPGEAVGVVTGSPVPEGVLSVLRAEHGTVGACGTYLEPSTETGDLEPGRHIRLAGAEAAAGDELVPAGRLVTPARVAAAAVAGYDGVQVIPRPRAGLLLTGDEVVEAGLPGPGQVRDVFSVALPAMLHDAGAELGPAAGVGWQSARRMADDAAALARAFRETPADLIVTSGGTARSAADPLRPALAELGAEILISSVDMRPGHPVVLARLPVRSGEPRRYVLGLPGNPLAGFAAFTALGVPLLRSLRGVGRAAALRTLEARAAEELRGARRGTRLLPVTVAPVSSWDSPAVRSVGHSGSHMMRGLAQAQALAMVPSTGLAAGDPVRCLPVPGAVADGAAEDGASVQEGEVGWAG